MSRDKNSDNSVLKLIKKLEHRKSDSDNSLSNKGLSKSSMKGRKGSSLASDKNPTDKGATCDKINTPAASDNGSTGKGTTHEKTDKRPVKDVARDTKVTRLESDKYCGDKSSTSTSQSHQLIITNSTTKPASNTLRKSTSDKGTTPVTLISGGTASDLSARVLSTNDEEFIIKTRVSDTEVNKRLNDMLVTPITRPELIMIDDVIRTRLISNPVATDKTFPIHVSHVYSTAAQINGDILVKSKAPADGSGRESNADDNAAALNPISNNDGRDKSLRRTDPSKDKSGLVVRARRPDSLTLSPMSPSDTDEDRTPRPLSGTFKSTDATPISEFSFVELPIRFRQYLDDNRLIRVPKPPYHHSSGVLEEQRKMENETRDAYKKLGTGDARETSREVSDDITVALDWIQQELRQMKSDNRALVRQLLGLGTSIHQLRGLTDCQSFNTGESAETGGDRTPDWASPVQTSASADFCILLHANQLTSPSAEERKRRTVMRSLETVSLSKSHADQNEFYV